MILRIDDVLSGLSKKEQPSSGQVSKPAEEEAS